jgi:hypothetical protein
MTIPWLALLVPLLEHWYIKTEALSFLYDDMDIISINNWTGNTVSLLTFCGGVNNICPSDLTVKPNTIDDKGKFG